jgi:predicted GIY-YIG superfamily endonuclease
MKRPTYIYALLDPDTGEIHYVGKTVDLERRYKDHLRARDKTPKDRWIKKLAQSKKQPDLKVLEKCAERNWAAKEKYWIDSLKRKGSPLLNQAPGGKFIPRAKRKAWLASKRKKQQK